MRSSDAPTSRRCPTSSRRVRDWAAEELAARLESASGPGVGPQAQGVLRRGLHRVRAVPQAGAAAGAVVSQVRLPSPRRAVAAAAGVYGPGARTISGTARGRPRRSPPSPRATWPTWDCRRASSTPPAAAGPSSSTSTTTGAGASGPPRRWPITARLWPFTPGLRASNRRRAPTSRPRTTTAPSSAVSASCSNTRSCCTRRTRGRRSPSSIRGGRRCRRRWTASTPSSGSGSTWRTATGSSTSSSTSS